MKKKLSFTCCSKCGMPIKHVFSKTCPKCGSYFVLKAAVNPKILIAMLPFVIVVCYFLIDFMYPARSNSMSYETFFIVKIITLIITAVMVIVLAFYISKRKKEADDLSPLQEKSSFVIKKIEVDFDNKYLAGLIFSFLIIVLIIVLAVIDVTVMDIMSLDDLPLIVGTMFLGMFLIVLFWALLFRKATKSVYETQ